MSVESLDLERLSADELAELIRKARAVKSQKTTPSIKVNAYVTSVEKHVNALLQAVKKLQLSEGVPQKKWDQVEAQLQRVQLDRYKDEAESVTLVARNGRGRGRARKR